MDDVRLTTLTSLPIAGLEDRWCAAVDAFESGGDFAGFRGQPGVQWRELPTYSCKALASQVQPRAVGAGAAAVRGARPCWTGFAYAGGWVHRPAYSGQDAQLVWPGACGGRRFVQVMYTGTNIALIDLCD